MFLHVGAEVSVCGEDIIGIFDYRLFKSESFQEFLAFSRWTSEIITLEGATKSIVISDGKIYLTPVTPSTLVRRWRRGREEAAWN
ncbi:MAG: extracellular matrix regulator RemB [Bacillota bacterium]|jgi:hypothetical protein|nr:DUF370 domain-containing protein [Bacillota bacterium]